MRGGIPALARGSTAADARVSRRSAGWHTAAAGGGVTIEDAPIVELRALLRLADQHVADAAELLGEAVELRERVMAVIVRKERG